MWSMPSCCLSRKKLRNVRRPAPAGSASTPKVVVLDLIKAAKSYVATPDFDSPVHVNLHQTKVYRTRVRYLVLQNWHPFFVFRVGILLLFDHFGAGKMISTSGAECMEATRKIARQCTYFVTVGSGTGTEKLKCLIYPDAWPWLARPTAEVNKNWLLRPRASASRSVSPTRRNTHPSETWMARAARSVKTSPASSPQSPPLSSSTVRAAGGWRARPRPAPSPRPLSPRDAARLPPTVPRRRGSRGVRGSPLETRPALVWPPGLLMSSRPRRASPPRRQALRRPCPNQTPAPGIGRVTTFAISMLERLALHWF